MKSKFIKEDEIYLIRKPKHSFLAVLGVDVSFPLNEEVHSSIETLKEKGFDVFFIFNPEENSEVNNINASRFTSLEEGVGFIISKSKGTAHQFIDVGVYISETVGEYAGITFSHLSTLSSAEVSSKVEEIVKKYTALAISSTTLPTLEISRKTREQLFYRYEDKGRVVVEPRFKQWRNKSREVEMEKDMLGRHSWDTHSSTTLFPFFRTGWIPEFKNKILEEEGWWESWNNCVYPLDLVASGIKFFDIPWLDRSPDKIDINSPTPVKEEKTKTTRTTKKKKDE